MTGLCPRQGAVRPAGTLARKQGRKGEEVREAARRGEGQAPISSLLLGGTRLADTDAGTPEEHEACAHPSTDVPTCPSQLSGLSPSRHLVLASEPGPHTGSGPAGWLTRLHCPSLDQHPTLA